MPDADYAVLREFLALPHKAELVLEKFAALPGAIRKKGGDKEGFVYIPGSRNDRVLLIAHADTVGEEDIKVQLEEDEKTLRNKWGILGGDDRAGCAMLYLLRETGHSLLITDGEEGGSFGAKFMERECPELFEEINQCQFMIQIDRCGASDFKCYKVGTEAFRSYIGEQTGFAEPDRLRGTDIVHLCRRICGVNLSCGYYCEHTENEYLVKEEWRSTLQLLRKWLAQENLPRFLLKEDRKNMFIDIHAHAYLFDSPPQDGHINFCKAEEVLRRYDELGIEKGVLLPLIGPEVYLPQSNQEVMEICRRYPDRFVPFFNIDPRGIENCSSTDFSVWINWFKEHGCLGVGEFMPNMYFRDERVLNIFRQFEAAGLPVIFDDTSKVGYFYGLVDEPGLPQLEFVLKKFPKLILLGHGPAFWSEMGVLETAGDHSGYPSYPIREEGAVPKLFRRYPNLWGDLSAGSGYNALARDVDHAVKFLNEFQDRLCFGTDICYATQELPLAGFLIELRDSGKISEEVFEKIARGNAKRLLNI